MMARASQVPSSVKAARKTLGVDAALTLCGLRDAHRANLRMHRARHRFSERADYRRRARVSGVIHKEMVGEAAMWST